MVTSSPPSATTSLMGGGRSSLSEYRSFTARSEFFTSSKTCERTIAQRQTSDEARRSEGLILGQVLQQKVAGPDAQAAPHHVVQVAGHVGEGELRVAVDADLRRVAILAHADGSRIVDGIVRHLARRALRADDACRSGQHAWTGHYNCDGY